MYDPKLILKDADPLSGTDIVLRPWHRGGIEVQVRDRGTRLSKYVYLTKKQENVLRAWLDGEKIQ